MVVLKKWESLTNGRTSQRDEEWRLTHVELSDEAGHVVVLEEFREDFLGKPLLIHHQEAVALL